MYQVEQLVEKIWKRKTMERETWIIKNKLIRIEHENAIGKMQQKKWNRRYTENENNGIARVLWKRKNMEQEKWNRNNGPIRM